MDRDYCTSAPDQAGLRRYRRRVTYGLRIKGVFCTGVKGECWMLMKEKRKRVVKIVVEEAVPAPVLAAPIVASARR